MAYMKMAEKKNNRCFEARVQQYKDVAKEFIFLKYVEYQQHKMTY